MQSDRGHRGGGPIAPPFICYYGSRSFEGPMLDCHSFNIVDRIREKECERSRYVFRPASRKRFNAASLRHVSRWNTQPTIGSMMNANQRGRASKL